MLTTNTEKEICKKYGAKDSNGKVHCLECPLNHSTETDLKCKCIAHFNQKTNRWELDTRRKCKK